jgi:hypothetical protein
MRTNGTRVDRRIDHDRGRPVEADAQMEAGWPHVYSIQIPGCTNRNPLAVVSTIISWTVNLEIANGARSKWFEIALAVSPSRPRPVPFGSENLATYLFGCCASS